MSNRDFARFNAPSSKIFRRAAAGAAAAGIALGMMGVGASTANAVPGGQLPTQLNPVVAQPEAQLQSGDRRAQVLAVAQQYTGIMYRWGGTTPAGFDCSGYTQFVFRHVGVNLPRTSSAQSRVGTRVSAAAAQPGDLIYKPGHIGIYAGNGMMYHSPRTGKPSQLAKVYSGSWSYIRVL